jgi:hypothetical protein
MINTASVRVVIALCLVLLVAYDNGRGVVRAQQSESGSTTTVGAVGVNYSEKDQRDLDQCREMRTQYGIIPGESFGSLPVKDHNAYLVLRCYRFFCKPHPLAGKGKFPCESIE